jgi:hypothetical protein
LGISQLLCSARRTADKPRRALSTMRASAKVGCVVHGELRRGFLVSSAGHLPHWGKLSGPWGGISNGARRELRVYKYMHIYLWILPTIPGSWVRDLMSRGKMRGGSSRSASPPKGVAGKLWILALLPQAAGWGIDVKYLRIQISDLGSGGFWGWRFGNLVFTIDDLGLGGGGFATCDPFGFARPFAKAAEGRQDGFAICDWYIEENVS